MVLFDRNLTYIKSPSWEEREEISHVVLGADKTKTLKIINWIINLLVPIAICYCTNCNLIAIAVAFIVTDVVLCVISNYITIQKPHAESIGMLLSAAKQNIADMTTKRDQLSAKMDEYKKNNCGLKCQMDCDTCPAATMIKDLRSMNTYLKYESEWVEKKLTPIKDAEMDAIVATEQKPAKEYADKAEYFAALAEKLDYFIKNHNFTFLKPISDSVARLIELLKMKPDGYALIPTTLYIYMDELQKILNKLTGLQTLQMGTYMEDLMKVSDALSKSINRTIGRIEKLDTNDIEVSLSVLINELIKEEEGTT